MKKFFIGAGILLVGTLIAVVLGVLYLPSLVLSRLFAIPYVFFRFTERSAESFYKQFGASYKKAVEDKAKTIAGITK